MLGTGGSKLRVLESGVQGWGPSPSFLLISFSHQAPYPRVELGVQVPKEPGKEDTAVSGAWASNHGSQVAGICRDVSTF